MLHLHSEFPVIPRKGFSVLPRLSRSLETIQFPLRQSAYSWLIHARSCANSVQFYGDSWHGVLYARSGQAYRGTALEAAWASHRGRSPSPCMATTSQIVCLVCEGSDSINNNNKHLRCGNRKGLLGRNDQTHHRMDPNTMASRPPTKQY